MVQTGPTAVVAGAGIAGLASALGLAQAGWQVTVLERAAELGEVGAGVALSRNGVASLRGLGLDDEAISSIGVSTRAGGTFDLRGGPIMPIEASAAHAEAVTMRGVYRPRLHDALLDRVRAHDVHVKTGAAVTDVVAGSPDGEQAVVTAGGTDHRADLVIAADGVNSAVRTALAPQQRPVYSGYSSWRAVVPVAIDPAVLTQYWGPHAEFGTMPVGPELTYWYGYVAMPQGSRLLDEHTAARERFAGWAEPVRDIIDATPPAAVLRHDVVHLPGGMRRYHLGRVLAVGDAAHAMLPTMGQGAATALEDGVCVARLVAEPVASGGELAGALAEFDAVRRPRCRTIARAALASALIGSHLGPFWQGARNALMRRTPSSVISRGAHAVMDWTPPPPRP
ncbi:FAD-dependent monooxygenase [Pseudactinotalea suaedae]|uniref:FAD-dependent monooxygenase n=1 Tax=Pseudactinotalea suaedae TaxID=1524924 RepID=UPI001F502725|nr:FAD-dependent monooxygenase [Pseudactinotalea suaedae]